MQVQVNNIIINNNLVTVEICIYLIAIEADGLRSSNRVCAMPMPYNTCLCFFRFAAPDEYLYTDIFQLLQLIRLSLTRKKIKLFENFDYRKLNKIV